MDTKKVMEELNALMSAPRKLNGVHQKIVSGASVKKEDLKLSKDLKEILADLSRIEQDVLACKTRVEEALRRLEAEKEVST